MKSMLLKTVKAKTYLGSFLFLFLFSCKKEQAALSKTDCGCANEVSAEFTINEISNFQWENKFLKTETDTSFSDKNISFFAKEENASYTWYIGSEILHTREVIRFFDESFANKSIPITLVVRKKPNLICYPNDNGYDSIKKVLPFKTTTSNIDTTFLEGAYRMKGNHLNDSIDMIIDYQLGTSTQDQNFYFDVYNYDGQGKKIVKLNTVFAVNFRETKGYSHLFGTFKLGLDGIAIYDFIDISTEIDKKYYYRGRKL